MTPLVQVLPTARLGDPWHTGTRPQQQPPARSIFRAKTLQERCSLPPPPPPAPPLSLPLPPLTSAAASQVLMAAEEKASSLLPSSQLIKQTLAYAKELERIV